MILTVFFVLFLGLPVIRLLCRSFLGEDGGVTLSVYQSVFQQKKFQHVTLQSAKKIWMV